MKSEIIDIMIEKLFLEYPTLKLIASGIFEIIIGEHSIRLYEKEKLVVLLKNNINQNIPNLFNKDNESEALIFFRCVISAVMDKQKYDEECKNNKNRYRFRNGELIPHLNLVNSKYYLLTNKGFLYVS